MAKKSVLLKRILAAIFTAILCIFAPLSIPLGPIPVSLTNFCIFLELLILGPVSTLISFGLYLLIGVAGLPVFSGFQGGFAKLIGPTGGFLIGFFVLIALSGILLKYCKNKVLKVCALIIGCWADYVVGSIWYAYICHVGAKSAFLVCVVPFVIIDIIKIIAVVIIADVIKQRIPD